MLRSSPLFLTGTKDVNGLVTRSQSTHLRHDKHSHSPIIVEGAN